MSYAWYRQKNWKLKDGWSDDFKKLSCAYCYFDCELDICVDRDYYCDNFEPNAQIEMELSHGRTKEEDYC